ncbi:hypothetical protein ARTSIC4J27_708 [Pseudarthrobacter siccitolerans]|uniref:Uncharacterized protein n=1 Tax=Pseudarthrobacter siccitolerans TaxID=861266 RepID=A0A024GYB4_9MICC|nr:hypothetical protein ARTSIC4J27_708 [Pseudarthrobacter siccitolerans]
MNLIIHRSLLRGHPLPAGLRRLHDAGHRLVTEFPQRAVPEPTLMLARRRMCALSQTGQ